MQPILQIQNLAAKYGDRVAVNNLSLSVNPGEILGLLGPNGSGKTTLFRILSTLISPTAGVVTYHLGSVLDVLRDRDEIRRHIGVVFQSPSLDKQLTAEENLRHHGHLYGLRGNLLRERIDQMLTRVGLTDRRHERVDRFSGGMRRRVELAKGMLNLPRILLLDEPSTGLDPGARIDLWTYLRQLRDQDGVSILLTTHLMEEADQCARLGIMDQGKLIGCDTPSSLKSQIGGDVISIQSHEPARISQIIREKFSLQPEELDGVVRIERHNAHQFLPELIAALPDLVDSVSVGKPTLQDVFIRMTGRAFRDQELV
jgi:ABC-2 type transport system ATP-binding protein